LFNQVAIKPYVWGEETDRTLLARTLAEDVPQVLDYLEGVLPRDDFLFGTPSIADVSIASFFRNAAFARFTIDAARWPATAGFVKTGLGRRTMPFSFRSAKYSSLLPGTGRGSPIQTSNRSAPFSPAMSGPNVAPTSRTISVPGGQRRSPTSSSPSST